MRLNSHLPLIWLENRVPIDPLMNCPIPTSFRPQDHLVGDTIDKYPTVSPQQIHIVAFSFVQVWANLHGWVFNKASGLQLKQWWKLLGGNGMKQLGCHSFVANIWVARDHA